MILGVDARVLAHRPTGVARYLEALLARWPQARRPGDRLILFADRQRPEGWPGEPDEVRVLRWPLPGGDPAWRQLRLAAALRAGPPDLLFCPFYSAPLGARVPTVVTVHDVSFAAHPEWFSRRARLAFRLAGPSARRAAAVLTVSRFSAEEIERRLAVERSKIHVVPLGVDASWFDPIAATEEQETRAWLGFDAPYVLHLGAVHARRCPELLLDAFVRIVSERPELRLVVAGPSIGPPFDFAARARARGLADRVVRREWVPEARLRSLLAGSRALVYLSLYEGFGLPALEAMAAGAPVVALRRASLPEVLGDAVVWVDAPRGQVVAEALRAVLAEDEARRQLVARARRRAEGFGWDAAAQSTFELLRRCAARPDGQPPRGSSS